MSDGLMLHWPHPTPWAPPPTRGCENANYAFKSAPPITLIISIEQCNSLHSGEKLLQKVTFVR